MPPPDFSRGVYLLRGTACVYRVRLIQIENPCDGYAMNTRPLPWGGSAFLNSETARRGYGGQYRIMSPYWWR
jgi:hypothetical protein